MTLPKKVRAQRLVEDEAFHQNEANCQRIDENTREGSRVLVHGNNGVGLPVNAKSLDKTLINVDDHDVPSVGAPASADKPIPTDSGRPSTAP